MPDVHTQFIDTGAVRFEVDTAGDPNGERLALLLHGFPDSKYSWRHQIPVFAKLGYKVWAPNQRGYGKTTRYPRVADYRLELLVDDVARLIDVSGCKAVTLVAHDWGGIVAWAAALTAVRPLERLIVMNIPHPRRMSQGLRTWRQLRKSWYVFFFQIPWLPELALTAFGARAVGDAYRRMAIDKSRFPDEVVDVYRHAALQPGAMRAMVNWYRAAVRTGGKLQRQLEAAAVLDVPTLMIWGEEDFALGKELTYGTEELVRDFTIRYFPGVSHFVHQEAPEAVNAVIEAWLTGKVVPEAEWGGKLASAAFTDRPHPSPASTPR
jgi:pimeloyl-ACP methyl ester carboxylesterase